MRKGSSQPVMLASNMPVIAGLVTELCGQSSSGKTQACLTIAVDIFVATGKRVIYIDSELSFSAVRLLQIGAARYPEKLQCPSKLTELSSSIIVIQSMDPAKVMDILKRLEEDVVKHNVGAIIIDSIPAICRSDAWEHQQKYEYLGNLAMQIKYVAGTYNILCVTTNQVNEQFRYEAGHATPGSTTFPALGLQWNHSANVRYLLSFDVHCQRVVSILKSPFSNSITVPFQITESGFIAVPC
eukprot:CRZ03280.1 hypothetical protein [Spongospora subterranea]